MSFEEANFAEDQQNKIPGSFTQYLLRKVVSEFFKQNAFQLSDCNNDTITVRTANCKHSGKVHKYLWIFLS